MKMFTNAQLQYDIVQKLHSVIKSCWMVSLIYSTEQKMEKHKKKELNEKMMLLIRNGVGDCWWSHS